MQELQLHTQCEGLLYFPIWAGLELEAKLKQGCALLWLCNAVDGGALHLSDTATLHIVPQASADSPPASSSGSPVTSGPFKSTHYTTTITNNTAKDLGGGVSINQDSSFDAAALVAVTHGNSAQYDQDVSVPLKEVQVLGPTYIPGVASRCDSQ